MSSSIQSDTPTGEIESVSSQTILVRLGTDDSQIYTRLTDRFATRANYSLDYRIYHLKQLAYLIKDNEQLLYAALKEDLDKGSWAADIEEVSDVELRCAIMTG
jgi:hypothetical protein